MKVLISVPAYNEATVIASVLNALPSELPGDTSVEVLVIDDGSDDGTADVAAAAGAIVVRHASNRGVGVAFRTALERALRERVDLMVTIDADGQFDPSRIPQLVEPILAGEADLVTGSRFLGGGRPADPRHMDRHRHIEFFS